MNPLKIPQNNYQQDPAKQYPIKIPKIYLKLLSEETNGVFEGAVNCYTEDTYMDKHLHCMIEIE